MRSLGYLNTVLTIIAVLLTLNLWTLWTSEPAGAGSSPVAGVFESQALAQNRKRSEQPPAPPNAGSQRKEMIRQMFQLNSSVDQLIAMFKDGTAKVRVQPVEDRD